MTTATADAVTWHPICALDRIIPNTGVAALIGRRQVAVFRLARRDGTGSVHAVSNFCPFAKAMVISRGIVGSRDAAPTVASPVYKQVFDLRTGACLDDPAVAIPSYPVQVVDGMVLVALP